MKTLALLALLSGQSADFASSLGHYEANPFMRRADGRFSPGRGLTIKVGVTTGLLLLQHRTALRHHPRAGQAMDLATGGAMWGQAVKNWRPR